MTVTYRDLIESRLDIMWGRYQDSTSTELLTALRRNQQAGRYLIAGDLAAMRAALERGQKVRDLGRPGLRRILEDRFEYVSWENGR